MDESKIGCDQCSPPKKEPNQFSRLISWEKNVLVEEGSYNRQPTSGTGTGATQTTRSRESCGGMRCAVDHLLFTFHDSRAAQCISPTSSYMSTCANRGHNPSQSFRMGHRNSRIPGFLSEIYPRPHFLFPSATPLCASALSQAS